MFADRYFISVKTLLEVILAMDKKKFKYYPLWNVDKLEDFLSASEENGWRLSCIKFSCIFYFTECKSKDADYVITYDMAKDNRPGMYEYEQELLSKYSAQRIPSKSTGYCVFRITGQNRDFKDLKDYRKNYLQHVIFQYMLISLIFLITGLFVLIASIYQNLSGCGLMIIFSYFFFTLALFIYRTYGYIKQRKICNVN